MSQDCCRCLIFVWIVADRHPYVEIVVLMIFVPALSVLPPLRSVLVVELPSSPPLLRSVMYVLKEPTFLCTSNPP